MTDAEIMMSLFEGSDVAYGSTELTGKVDRNGKHEAKCFVIRKPVTLEHWNLHLAGKAGLGILPINSRSLVRFGAIDVDVYKDLDLAALNHRLQEFKIPMVLCRSKSGGPHLFMFFKEPVPAKLAVEKLDAIAGFMGFGKSEIFPKQTSVEGNDVGNFINMPYFGGTNFLRYGYDQESKALPDVPAFARFAATVSLDLAGLEAFTTPAQAGPLPDGPPCLNRIFLEKHNENRNIVLSNAAVYCKKAYGTHWEAKLDELNRLFPDPLGVKEVEAIKKSYNKKDYRYQCHVSPLSKFCNSSACRKCEFGVGTEDLMPAHRSLTKINSTPPLWFLDVIHRENGQEQHRRMSLTTEELQNPRLFQRRCMEVIHKMPPMVKPEDWQPKIAQLMSHVNTIEIPKELSPEGQFAELVQEFLLNRASAESYEDLLRGLPHKNQLGYHFRARDLWKFITNQRFVMLKQHEMLAVLYQDMGAVRAFRKIGGIGVNYLTLELSNQPAEKLEVTKPQVDY